jgi:hypothetical protein
VTRSTSAPSWGIAHDEDGALGPVCDPLADASESVDAVQAARADDDEVGRAWALDEGGGWLSGVPAVHAVGPGALGW